MLGNAGDVLVKSGLHVLARIADGLRHQKQEYLRYFGCHSTPPCSVNAYIQYSRSPRPSCLYLRADFSPLSLINLTLSILSRNKQSLNPQSFLASQSNHVFLHARRCSCISRSCEDNRHHSRPRRPRLQPRHFHRRSRRHTRVPFQRQHTHCHARRLQHTLYAWLSQQWLLLWPHQQQLRRHCKLSLCHPPFPLAIPFSP